MKIRLALLNSRMGKFGAAMVLALIVSGLIYGMDRAGWLTGLETRAHDGLMYARSLTRTPPPRDSPVVIVGIDDRTYDDPAFHIPLTLWNDYFAAVIQGLTQAEVKAIGLDFILPRASFDHKVPNYGRTWLRALNMAVTIKKIPLITGVSNDGERTWMPEARYLQIIRPENIGLFNLTNDGDDFIRRQKLYLSMEGTEPRDCSFGYLLAKAYRPDLKTDRQTITIDFRETPEPFRTYSFAEVYQRASASDIEYLKERFKGKLVLIGETDSRSPDKHATPLYHLPGFGGQRTAGVEIWAHVIDTLLADRIFEPMPRAGRWLAYFGLAAIVCLATILAVHRLWPVVFPLLVVGSGVGSLYAFHQYVLPPLAAGWLGLAVSQAGAFVYRYWWVDREKRQVRHAFSRYLSPEVVAEIMAKPHLPTLGGARGELTVFFSDLAGFTSISELLSPEDLVGLLNRYLTRMTTVILKWGGYLDKYEGDAIMAFWGAPALQPDHAARACLAALEQQEEVERFRREIAAEGLPRVHVRMGINTGPMIVGNVGSEERLNYTVMGDSVNLASRLEGANKAFGSLIMISEFTYEQVRGLVEVRELDLLRVKGKNFPIRVYELLSKAGELGESKASVRDRFREGLEMYRARRFQEAEERFVEALAEDPDDGPSRTYVERCRRFQAAPPPEDWDGVFTMTVK